MHHKPFFQQKYTYSNLLYAVCQLSRLILIWFSSVCYFVDRKCGGLLQERSGTFETPNYPNSYPSEVVCLWVIRVPKAKSIIVTIETFDIGKETGDFLAYSKDGSYPSTQEPVRINNPGTQELTFQGETALFEFFSDGKINAKGFLARYSSDLRQNTPGREKWKVKLCFGSSWQSRKLPCKGVLFSRAKMQEL